MADSGHPMWPCVPEYICTPYSFRAARSPTTTSANTSQAWQTPRTRTPRLFISAGGFDFELHQLKTTLEVEEKDLFLFVFANILVAGDVRTIPHPHRME